MSELKSFRTIEAERYATASAQLKRKIDPAMPTIDELVAALWEHIVERRPEGEAALAALQARRVAVKARHPKRD